MTNTGIQIPQRLAENQAHINGEAGRRWIAQLPALVREVTEAWGLTLGPPFTNGFSDYAAVVRRGGDSFVLKVCFPDHGFISQEAALRAFDEQASVRLFNSDIARGALLLEHIEPGTPLSGAGDDAAQIHAAAELMQRLWRRPPAGHSFESVSVWLDRANLPASLSLQKRSRPWIAEAFQKATELLRESTADRLLHGDLHFDNILLSRRGWLTIDPNAVIGDPAWEIAPLLFNNLDAAGFAWPSVVRRRIDQLCDELSLERERAYAITAARCLQARFWSLRDESIPGAGHVEQALYCAEELAKGP